jgi:hypothetical protein
VSLSLSLSLSVPKNENSLDSPFFYFVGRGKRCGRSEGGTEDGNIKNFN